MPGTFFLVSMVEYMLLLVLISIAVFVGILELVRP